jgi:cytochrome oxidase Cu insertion factor (SCO1/SenC/PrrC family)
MKLVKLVFGAVMLTALAFSGSSAWAQRSPIASEHALKIGDKAPDFELPSQDDKKISLKELTKKGAVALVFHRSADW